ncbi:UDP-N-acetylglucosamine 2-epimerase (hydrolyzing) [Paenibacillus tritici]|uniref:UDP-N-acetylglucosamine 2-epimerase n=1 Tax=Paenibacillus tritici TaxID=1873425 RepID=UPI001BA4733B|nr:UDP-N-acetylglucosamine 2-epimerase [Paenibacillus tritici]QUL54550.1 UDP-N-acetylglucosamine 2-epimerase (hydrolyzing) [Paenibacillus tritici]
MNRRKICIVTGTRAEYGLLFRIMKEIQADDELELQLIATGMHLSPEFGLTYKQIEEDGFIIDEKIEMLLSSDTPVAIAKSMGIATLGFAEAFQRLKPDILVLLGDRFEIFSAAQTALVMRIPVAHISGGELTEGAIDESIRHSLTKMSHIHFTANEDYTRRVIQLGEQPDRVFNVGDTGVENIRKMTLLTKEELSVYYSWDLNKYFLITFHPATLESSMAEEQVKNLLFALNSFPDYKIIFTKSNADTDSRRINELIDEYTRSHPERVKSFFSLGQIRYLSTMKYCALVIGNSSSGIVEAPVFSKPTINIGDRQKGRLKADSIIDCPPTINDITEAIQLALSVEFQNGLNQLKLKYEGQTTSADIKDYLKKIDLSYIIKKKFYDINR